MKTIVLYAEDEPADIFLLERAVAKLNWIELHTVVDGIQALEWITGNGRFADRQRYPVPDLLVLDLKLPRKSGWEILERLRHGTQVPPPVVVYSSSIYDKDVARARQLGAVSFITKSAHCDTLLHEIRRIAQRHPEQVTHNFNEQHLPSIPPAAAI